MPTLRPFGRDRWWSASIASIICSKLSTETMPVWLHSVFQTRVETASVPVCDADARIPASVCPPFSTTIGFARDISRADRSRRSPSRMPSR